MRSYIGARYDRLWHDKSGISTVREPNPVHASLSWDTEVPLASEPGWAATESTLDVELPILERDPDKGCELPVYGFEYYQWVLEILVHFGHIMLSLKLIAASLSYLEARLWEQLIYAVDCFQRRLSLLNTNSISRTPA